MSQTQIILAVTLLLVGLPLALYAYWLVYVEAPRRKDRWK